jgi:hypothetical protein
VSPVISLYGRVIDKFPGWPTLGMDFLVSFPVLDAVTSVLVVVVTGPVNSEQTAVLAGNGTWAKFTDQDLDFARQADLAGLA